MCGTLSLQAQDTCIYHSLLSLLILHRSVDTILKLSARFWLQIYLKDNGQSRFIQVCCSQFGVVIRLCWLIQFGPPYFADVAACCTFPANNRTHIIHGSNRKHHLAITRTNTDQHPAYLRLKPMSTQSEYSNQHNI